MAGFCRENIIPLAVAVSYAYISQVLEKLCSSATGSELGRDITFSNIPNSAPPLVKLTA
jgi:hypothetical protein